MDPSPSIASARERLYAIDPRDLAEEVRVLQRKYSDAVPFLIKPFDAYVLVACLQLAWRHPHLSAAQRAIIETYGRQFQTTFDTADTPLLKLTTDMGWVPEMDR